MKPFCFAVLMFVIVASSVGFDTNGTFDLLEPPTLEDFGIRLSDDLSSLDEQKLDGNEMVKFKGKF